MGIGRAADAESRIGEFDPKKRTTPSRALANISLRVTSDLETGVRPTWCEVGAATVIAEVVTSVTSRNIKDAWSNVPMLEL